MKSRTGWLALAAIVLAVGCADPMTATTEMDLTGRWEGTIEESGQMFTLTLSDQGGTITGAGNISSSFSGTPRGLTVTGAALERTVTLSMESGSETVTFDGVVVDDENGAMIDDVYAVYLEGTLTGSGFEWDPIRFFRRE